MASFLEPIKNFFGIKHKGSVLGIDIGSSSIKIVLLEKVNEKAILRNYGEIALGPRAEAFVGQATNLPTEKIVEALKDILRETGIVSRHIVMAVPFSASLLTIVELPDVKKKELATMISIEARRYIPIPISEVSLDWWVLPKRKKQQSVIDAIKTEDDKVKKVEMVEVIIAAIHNDVIKKYEMIKQDMHFLDDSFHFEIEIFSTLRSVVDRDLAPILVIDIGAGSTKLALVDGGIVRGSHIISMGGQDITLGLSRSRGITFNQAEEVKCRVGLIGDDEGRDVLSVAELLLASSMNEALRFAENYERKYETKIAKVVLVGGGSRLKGLEKIVKQTFSQAVVEIGDPFARIDTPAFLSNTIKDLSPNFAVAVGAALKGLEE